MIRTLTAGAVAVLLLLPLGLVVAVAGFLAPPTTTFSLAAGCMSWDPSLPAETELEAGQVERAAVIYQVALDVAAGPAGAVVGIATAMQESSLGANPAAMAGPNADGDVGLFQQRSLVGWYADGATQAENLRILADDRYQATTFFTGHTTLDGWHIPGLLNIDQWQAMTVTQAAQKVQRSAHPDAYARHEALARSLVARFQGHPPGDTLCGTLDPSLNCAPTGLRSEAGQTPDALRVMRCIHARWPQTTLLGVRPGDPRDHGTGRAVDVMIPHYRTDAGIALGDEIAHWARTNAAKLGVTYIIWRQHLWSVARADEGWRRCGVTASCYTGPDPSAAHLDHVHISVHGHTTTQTSAAFVLPLENYRLTARFGQSGRYWAKRHTGLDFAAPTGTPLKAITSGTITRITNHGAYGLLTTLTTDTGEVLYYAHQSRTHVRQGQRVTAGQIIGNVGATGNTAGAHLHLEVRVGNTPIDPYTWLRQRGLTP